MKYILFSDDEFFNIELEAKTIRMALREAKDRFCTKGKLRKTKEYSNIMRYKLINSDYTFTLTLVY